MIVPYTEELIKNCIKEIPIREGGRINEIKENRRTHSGNLVFLSNSIIAIAIRIENRVLIIPKKRVKRIS